MRTMDFDRVTDMSFYGIAIDEAEKEFHCNKFVKHKNIIKYKYKLMKKQNSIKVSNLL